MDVALLEILRCPFCGTRLTLVESSAHRRSADRIESGVLGCECCAYPVVDGIPVLLTSDAVSRAIKLIEAEATDEARRLLLGLVRGDDGDEARAAAFEHMRERGDAVTYREAVELLSPDAEGTYFVYRFSDPTYVLARALVRTLLPQLPVTARVLDLCGGSGHLTRELRGPGRQTVLADMYFWKLWLATRLTSPGCTPVCCDGNNPLPFARDTFGFVVLSDAFPYIWHKRQLADEMVRLAGEEGLILLPHLHSSLGENFSAGMTLTPSSYRDLFERVHPRLFSDAVLLDNLLDRGLIDLAHDVAPAALDGQPSLTLVASRREAPFREYRPDLPGAVSGVLALNPLYQVVHAGDTSRLTLRFPTTDYEEEFGECRRYLPESVVVDADLRGPLDEMTLAARLGSRYDDLRRRLVLLDLPPRYS